MKRRCKPFLGHPMTKTDQSAVTSLIGFTTLPLGMPKKRVKSEQQLWEITEKMFGLRPFAGEEFITSVRRIRSAIKAIAETDRQDMRRKFSEEHGDLIVRRHVNAGRQPRLPRPPREPMVYGSEAMRPIKVRNEFYLSWEWRRLRMKIIKQNERRCMCCGATPEDTTISGDKVRLVVDHIKPLSKYWALRLDPANLQILCDECNMGKGAWDETDHRSESERLIAEQLRYEIGVAA